MYDMLVNAVEDFELCGSGWVLDQLLRQDLHVLEFVPLRASTYLPLPKELHDKKAVVNIRNNDQCCFLWTAIAGVFGDSKTTHPERVAHYQQWENEFNMEGIEMPMALKDIPKFERRNNISVSVYGYDDSKKDEEEGFVYPLQVTCELRERHVNMLLITDDDTNHYCLIKNFSRLVRSQVTKHEHTHYF